MTETFILTDKLKVKGNLQKFNKRNQVNQSSNQSYSVFSNSAIALAVKSRQGTLNNTSVYFLYFVFKNQNFRLSDRFIFIERQKVLSVTRMSSSDTYFRHWRGAESPRGFGFKCDEISPWWNDPVTKCLYYETTRGEMNVTKRPRAILTDCHKLGIDNTETILIEDFHHLLKFIANSQTASCSKILKMSF